MAWIEQSIGGRAGMAIAVALVGYILGCIATGYYLVRWKTGQDIRELGSKNIGARNAGRVLGRSGFLLTLVGDFAKGTLAVGFAWLLTHDSRFEIIALIAALLGHLWPVQLEFRGGKGISTSLGGLLFFGSLAGCFIVFFLAGYALFRKTVLAGLFAYALLPAACFYLSQNATDAFGFCLLSVLILFAHRRNAVDELKQWCQNLRLSPTRKRLLKKL